MSKNRDEADLLAQYWDELSANPSARPPKRLDGRLAAVAKLLNNHARPPDPDQSSVGRAWARIMAGINDVEPTPPSQPDQDPQTERHSLATQFTAARDRARGVGQAASADFPHPSAPRTNVWEWARDEITRMPLVEKHSAVDEIRALLRNDKVRLLTLNGPPGIGKTRLALEAAVRLLPDFPHGVFIISLATAATTARNPNLIVPAIAQALRIADASEGVENDEVQVRELLTRLKSHLRRKRMLLLLDRFDRVPGAEAAVVKLLKGTKYLKVLVTKQLPLGVKGEITRTILPLSLPDHDWSHLNSVDRFLAYGSVQLFHEEIRTKNPNFAITPDTLQDIAEICHLLGGSPLAIQLVAAHVAHLSPRSILQQLRESDLIVPPHAPQDGVPALPDPEAILKGVLDWSYNRLDSELQALYRGLGIFWGGRTLESIEAVCYPSSDLSADERRIHIGKMVNALVDLKLLQPYEGVHPNAAARGEQRYWMWEPIHDHSREKLEKSGELEVLRQRHADYLLAFIHNARSEIERSPEQQAEWRARLTNELENIRRAARKAHEGGDSERTWRLTQAMLWVRQELAVRENVVGQGAPHSLNKKLIRAQLQLISRALASSRLTAAEVDKLSDRERQISRKQREIIALAARTIIDAVSDDITREDHEIKGPSPRGSTGGGI